MGLGRLLIIVGLVLVGLGLLLNVGGGFPLGLGRLPGDITVRGKNSFLYFPITTCIVLSVVLSLIMWLFSRR